MGMSIVVVVRARHEALSLPLKSTSMWSPDITCWRCVFCRAPDRLRYSKAELQTNRACSNPTLGSVCIVMPHAGTAPPSQLPDKRTVLSQQAYGPRNVVLSAPVGRILRRTCCPCSIPPFTAFVLMGSGFRVRTGVLAPHPAHQSPHPVRRSRESRIPLSCGTSLPETLIVLTFGQDEEVTLCGVRASSLACIIRL
jgi:hypothetical protein